MASEVKKTTGATSTPNKNRRKRSAYERKAALRRRFLSNLTKVIVICAIIICSGLGYLWFWLSRYESRSQNGAMLAYLNDIQERNWDKIYREDTRYFSELNSKETIIAYLTYLYGDKNTSGIVFSYAGGDDTNAWYDAYYRSEKFAALELVKPEDSEVWKVRTIPTNREYSVDVLDWTAFRINDVPITEEYSYEDGHIPYGFEGLGLDDQLPVVRRYTIGSFIDQPNPVPEDSENNMSIRDYSGNYLLVGPKPTNEQYATFASLLQETAFAYVSFITGEGTYYSFSQYLYPNTVFDNFVRGFDNRWYPDHESAEYQNIELTDIMPVGDSAFIGTISFDYFVSTDSASRTESATYQMYYVKDSNDEWKLTNMVIIASTDTTLENETTE